MAQRPTSGIAQWILIILAVCRPPLSAQPLKDLFRDHQVPVKNYSSLANLTPAGSFFYFTLNDDRFGSELWRSDGTASGTYRVKDILQGPSSAAPENFLMVNGVLCFTANDGVHGRELWRSDGTEAGTSIVKDLAPGENSSNLQVLASTDNILFFQVENETDTVQLWKTDGTPAGTVLVGEVSSENGAVSFCEIEGIRKSEHGPLDGVSLTDVQSPMDLIAVDHLLFFTSDDPRYGRELWRSDGTAAGTAMIKDILPGPASSQVLSYSTTMAELNGLLYFLAQNGVHGAELWRSDGTPEGTSQVKDISPGSGSSFIHGLTSVNGLLYFSAYDGSHGNEVWRSDGTSSGTWLLKDIFPGAGSSHPRNFTAFNDRVYFSVLGPDGIELWKTDGTTTGTLKVFPETERVAKID
jgi:trimeric autotransporter adhesin